MYMRIVRGRIVSGQWDAFESAFEQAVQMIGSPAGFKGRWLARDKSDADTGCSITLWESEADMKAFWNSKERTESMSLLQPYFVNEYTVSEYEVRLQR